MKFVQQSAKVYVWNDCNMSVRLRSSEPLLLTKYDKIVVYVPIVKQSYITNL